MSPPASRWRRFSRRRGARAGLCTLLALAAVSALADVLASDLPLLLRDPRDQNRSYVLPCLTRPPALADDDNQTLAARASFLVPPPIPYGPYASRPGGTQSPLAPPSLRHLLGTDDRGRDVAARMIHGARTALLVGAGSVALYLLAGLLVGVACAASPAADLVLGRAIEVALSIPTFFLLLAVQGVFLSALAGGPSLLEVCAAIALTRWPDIARLVRAESLRLAASPHVEAARGLGATPLSIMWWHSLPFAAGPAVTAAALGLGQAVLLETGLSFLGFGAPPPTASWGELLAEAQSSGLPLWLLLPPALAIAVTVLASQRVADGLAAVLDPREESPIDRA